MGIINVNQDSFFSGSRANSIQQILQLAEKHISEGAAFIDIGATSTKPGSGLSHSADEIQTLKSLLPQIKKAFPEVYISVDTYHAPVVNMVANEGADLINDISAGQIDQKLFETVAQTQLPYVLMHMKGTPETMQKNPHYEDVVGEVIAFLAHKLQLLHQLGVKDVIVDPGFGFGKSLDQNYSLLNGLDEFVQLHCPLLVGVSRKSMVTRLLDISAEEALNATTALHMLALQKGASILRVHDVKPAMEAIRVFEKFCATQSK